ncbi:MAG TPA: hypothetical protein VFJ58_11395 [Armatimonadota bacterium]|nr:hypothetical protein [Armatimonadota bacterium]
MNAAESNQLSAPGTAQSRPSRAADVHAGFLTPPRDCGPLPYWFWNGRLDENELLHQLGQINAAGCAGAIIYPRHGLRTRYLSDEWIRLVGVVAAKSRKLGLALWIADSENWPGGTPAGANDAWYLKIARQNAAGETPHVFHTLGATLAACAFLRPGDQTQISDPADLLDLTSQAQGSRLEWTPPDGRSWEVVIFSAFRYAHADLMADGAGERLLASTHSVYEAALGDLKSAGITGFYSDEIALLSIWNLPDEHALPWTPALAQSIALDDDDGLLPALLPLALETFDSARRRQRYYEALADRCESHFFQPVRLWLDERGLLWGGHFLFEEPLIEQAHSQADLGRMIRYFDLPAVDNLRLAPPGNEVNLVCSIARQSDRPAAVEAFGGSGWGLDLKGRRRNFDLLAVRGATRLIPHGLFYSSAGKRKLENPPSEFLREPFGVDYPSFADHVRRICWIMTQGRATPRIALFYPLRSAWRAPDDDGFSRSERGMSQALEDDFHYVTTLLDELQYEYEIVDETALAAAELIGNRIRIGSCDFPILVLPSVTTIARAAWERIIEFFEQGGRVFCLGMMPDAFEDGPSEELARQILKLAAIEVDLVRQAYLLRAKMGVGGQEVYTFTRKNPDGGRLSAIQAALSLDPEFARGEARQTLHALFPPDFDCRDARIRCRRRSLGGLDLYWVVSTADETIDARVGLRSHGAPEIWNSVSGAREPIWQYIWVGTDQSVVSLRLAPGEGVLVAVPLEEEPHVEAANFVPDAVNLLPADENKSPSTAARRSSNWPGVEIRGWDDPARALKPVASLNGPPQVIWKRGAEPITLAAPAVPAPPILNLRSGWALRRLDPNVLVLDEWRWHADERGRGWILMWQRRPHPDWDLVPPRQTLGWFPELEPIERNRPSYAWYQTGFSVQEWQQGRPLWIALDAIDAPYRCWVNGDELTPQPASAIPSVVRGAALQDPMLSWIDLSAVAETGHHVVTLLADYRETLVTTPDNRARIPVDLVPGRARLVGEFAVIERPRGLALTAREPREAATGSWTDFGYPHYSGGMLYEQEVNIPAEYEDAQIFIEIGSAAAVVHASVNEKSLVLPWEPFRVDITSLVTPGKSAKIGLIIRNNCANALLGRMDPSGLLQDARLAAYPRVQISSRQQ